MTIVIGGFAKPKIGALARLLKPNLPAIAAMLIAAGGRDAQDRCSRAGRIANERTHYFSSG
jgi:hypothetical protein